MNNTLSLGEYEDANIKIQKNMESRKLIEEKITELQDQVNRIKLEEHLLNLKLKSPVIVHTDENIGDYRFLSENLILNKLDIVLYPLWLTIECTYPRWSRDFMSLNIVNYRTFNKGKGYEVLINGLKNSLGCSYQEASDIINDHRLDIPCTYCHDYVLDSNIKINFSEAETLDKYQHKKYNYYLSCSEDDDMVLNTVKIKYILVLSVNYSYSFDNFFVDII